MHEDLYHCAVAVQARRNLRAPHSSGNSAADGSQDTGMPSDAKARPKSTYRFRTRVSPDKVPGVPLTNHCNATMGMLNAIYGSLYEIGGRIWQLR